LAGGPPIIAGIDAAEAGMSLNKKNVAIMGVFKGGFFRFINNLSYGIMGTIALPGSLNLGTKDGGTYTTEIGAGVPRGSLLAVMSTGFVMMLTDYASTYLTGNRETKIIGTNMTATGTR
jgi:hypothetical protein